MSDDTKTSEVLSQLRVETRDVSPSLHHHWLALHHDRTRQSVAPFDSSQR